MKTAGSFIIMASFTLLVLYFFLSKWINLLLIWIYVVLGANAMSTIAFHLICRHRPHLTAKTLKLWFLGAASPCGITVCSVCLAVCAIWGLERGRTGMWVIQVSRTTRIQVCADPDPFSMFFFQDMMGVAVIILLLCVLKIPNMKIATALFCALIFYDVFWVFLSPYLFQVYSYRILTICTYLENSWAD